MPPGTAPTIEVEGVTKWFRDLVALSDVSISVGPGITALLGPNGAGKSTLLRLLCGLTGPSRGQVRVLGQDPRRSIELFRRIGLVPQQEVTFEADSGLAFVRSCAALHRVPDPEAAARRALGLVDLDPEDRRPISAYSKGMRQRAKVAGALAHDPEVLFLDEPLEGLDPRQRRRAIGLFRQLAAEGKTVLVSSHVLDEVEKFGSRVLVIAQGRLAAEGDFHAIRALMEDRPHQVRITTDRPQALAAGLLSVGAVLGVRIEPPGAVVVDTPDIAALRRSLARVAREQNARLREVVSLDEDLESVFRYLVARTQ
jgi:ABC-2 type transport system ATP-binding protein